MSIPKTQIGYGYERGTKHIIKYDSLPVDEPKDNEVLLKIEAAGLCQSDVHILIAQDKDLPPKFIMGHEIAGQIVKVGKNLKSNPKYQPGSRYSVTTIIACGTCKYCKSGRDNSCPERIAYGISADGGFRQYMTIKNLDTLIPIPDGVSYASAAVATDSVLTPFHAIGKVKHLLDPTAKVAIFGLGGLGLNAVQILRQYGCHIVACDVKPELEKQALLFGANEFYTDINQSKHAPESFDVCFDFCGLDPTFEAAQKYIASAGHIVMVGLGRFKLKVYNYDLGRRDVTIHFNFGGTWKEQCDCLTWVDKGKVHSVVKEVELTDLPHYLGELAKGKVQGRVVFRPHKL